MNITYISHASYMIESRDGKTRVLIDPWLEGSTYMDQAWLAWSYPGTLDRIVAPNSLLFTHYHKDHFHTPSLERISRSCNVVVPTTPGSFFREKVQELGWTTVYEISSGAPLRIGDFEVHSVRINDHWEFLDETAYLIVEGDQAALFLADLWYLPEGLLRRLCAEFHVCFAAVPWGGSLQDLCVMPEGFRLGSFEDYYLHGMDESVLLQKNAVQDYEPYLQVGRVLHADCMTPGSYGFGLIWPDHDLVQPAPVNSFLNQDEFIRTLPDPALRAGSHSMYPGDQFTPEDGFQRYPGSSRPNTPVTDSMRALTLSRKNARIQLDGEFISRLFLKKIDQRISQLQSSSDVYQSKVSELLRSSREAEFQVVNESRQAFLFEQRRDRFTMSEVTAPTGVQDIVYIPPSVMTSLVTEWGPTWTEAEFSGLVKVSATGWAPYLFMKQLFC